MDPNSLNKRVEEYIEEYKIAQTQLIVNRMEQACSDTWQPPPPSVYKLNFDAVIFAEQDRSGVEAIVRND